jgi:hypothetical protein
MKQLTSFGDPLEIETNGQSQCGHQDVTTTLAVVEQTTYNQGSHLQVNVLSQCQSATKTNNFRSNMHVLFSLKDISKTN